MKIGSALSIKVIIVGNEPGDMSSNTFSFLVNGISIPEKKTTLNIDFSVVSTHVVKI